MNRIIKKIKLKNQFELVIRQAEISDAEAMISYLNIVGGESDNLLFGENEFLLSQEQEEKYITAMMESPNALMVIGVINNEIVAVAQIASQLRKRIEHNGEVAISVKKKYWSMGVGTEIMKVLIEFAKETKVIKNITLGVKGDNYKGRVLYEKMGFKQVGVHKNFFNIDGVYDDEILMDLYI